MALMNFIKGQFINVIEWTDNTSNTIVYKFPVHNSEIKMGAQLTVRESQAAVFVNEGVIADVFSPGRYELSTQNMPIFTSLKSWKYGFNSPFKADIYFVNTKQFTNQRWGTTNPVMMRDPELGVMRLRGFGAYSFRVSDPDILLRELFGTASTFKTDDIIEHFKRLVVSAMSDHIAEMQIPAFDLAMHYDKIADGVREKLKTKFTDFGLKLMSVTVENISLPPEVEKVLDQKTSMGVIGNINQYAQYQAAEAIRDAAKNPGGAAGAGIGMGAGVALGNMMGNMFSSAGAQGGTSTGAPNAQGYAPQSAQGAQGYAAPGVQGTPGYAPQAAQGSPQAATAQAGSGAKCGKCGHPLEQNAKFCLECGTPVSAQPRCRSCGAAIAANAKFCPECGISNPL